MTIRSRKDLASGKDKIPVGYALSPEAVGRLRTYAAVTGRSAGEILDTLIKRWIPEYEICKDKKFVLSK
jgi:hypothetical protein